MPVLISVPELAEAIASDRRPVLLDVRWSLGGPPGHRTYLDGHIPTAVYVDLDSELAAQGEPAREGRHPLPSLESLQAAARRWGIEPGDTVVAYDGAGNLAAARVWWLLRAAGLVDVRLLDGALPAWVAAGHPLAKDDVEPEPGAVVLARQYSGVLSFPEVAGFPDAGVLLDARAAERYLGDTEPVDPKAGHIPGAVNAPTVANLTAAGTFKPPAELAAGFAAVGADGSRPVAVYCGSGVTAAHEIAALHIAGVDALLYPGSWSQWSNNDLPVAVGAELVAMP